MFLISLKENAFNMSKRDIKIPVRIIHFVAIESIALLKVGNIKLTPKQIRMEKIIFKITES